MVKAGGEKGSEACWSTLRTFFADNADPWALQPIAVERGFWDEFYAHILATPKYTGCFLYMNFIEMLNNHFAKYKVYTTASYFT